MTAAETLLAIPATTAVLVLALARHATLAGLLAVLGAVVTLAVSVLALAGAAAGPVGDPFADGRATGGETVLGGIDLPLATSLSSTSAFLVLTVSLVVAAVQTYSAWFLADDDRRGVFHATIALFAGAMILVVLSSDLVLTIVGWEVMGWCSYLLIGHWSRRPGPRRAAHTAFLVTRLADVGFLLGMAVLVAGAGTTARAEVVTHWTSAAADPTLRSTALVLVVVGVLGKSAQLPFHDWLLGAMEGPTPASALIHAATMVAAGTVVLSQLLPVLVRADTARAVLGISVAATMVLAALLALLEPDLKRLLAWSTISQVGVMLAPLAAAGADHAAGSALGHLYGHAIFKALLFLTIGWLAMTSGSTRGSALVGSARTHRVALFAWVAGLVSLAGVPLVLGGVTKEHVIAAVAEDDSRGGVPSFVLAALLITVVLTAAYAVRALLVAVRGVGRTRPGAAPARAVMPGAVAGILLVLGVASVLGGLALGVRLPRSGDVPLGLFVGVLVLVLVGIGAGWVLERTGIQARLVDGRAGALVGRGLHVEGLQQRLVVRPVLALARLVAFLDREVIDSYVRTAAWGALGLGGAGTRAHAGGRPTTGLALLGLGVLLVTGIGVLALWGAS